MQVDLVVARCGASWLWSVSSLDYWVVTILKTRVLKVVSDLSGATAFRNLLLRLVHLDIVCIALNALDK